MVDPPSILKLSEILRVRYAEQLEMMSHEADMWKADFTHHQKFGPVRYYGLLEASFSRLMADYPSALLITLFWVIVP
jgi:hypothetical protein